LIAIIYVYNEYSTEILKKLKVSIMTITKLSFLLRKQSIGGYKYEYI